MNPTKDKTQGTMNKASGHVKATAGKMIGDRKLEAKGEGQKLKGKAQTMGGKIKESVKGAVYATGDSIEKAGRKLQQKGYTKVGTKIERAGDKIEHSAD